MCRCTSNNILHVHVIHWTGLHYVEQDQVDWLWSGVDPWSNNAGVPRLYSVSLKLNLYIVFLILFSLACLSDCLAHVLLAFYRVMYISAIACRPSVSPSVRQSVTLVDCDHIGWKSWKLTARTISQTPLLFVAQRQSTCYAEILGRLEVRWRKVACWRTKAAKSLKRVKIEEKLLWTAYKNSPTLFRTVQFRTPCGLPFPKIGGFATITQSRNLTFGETDCW